MTTDKALDLALEALEGVVKNCWRDIPSWRLDEIKERITAIKQARSAPVQEPDHGDELTIAYMSGVHRGKELAVQRQWTGLTDKEFENIIMSAPNATVPVFLWQLIQDKLKEKNT
jgi:hypothetical protein